MSQSRRRHARLQAYRELGAALCALAESLFEQELAARGDEAQAALAASCALVARLEGASPGPGPGLLRRLDALSLSAPRRRARRRPAAPPPG